MFAVEVLPAQVVLFESVAIVQDDAVAADIVVLTIPERAEEWRQEVAGYAAAADDVGRHRFWMAERISWFSLCFFFICSLW